VSKAIGIQALLLRLLLRRLRATPICFARREEYFDRRAHDSAKDVDVPLAKSARPYCGEL